MGRLNDSAVFNTRGELAIGETRTVHIEDRVITIQRTNRPYVYDLCDAYNASGRGGWFVDHAGNLKLGAAE